MFLYLQSFLIVSLTMRLGIIDCLIFTEALSLAVAQNDNSAFSSSTSNNTTTVTPLPPLKEIFFQSGGKANHECKLKYREFSNSYLRFVERPHHTDLVTSYKGCFKSCCYAENFTCKSFSYFWKTRQCFLMNVTQHDKGVVLAHSKVHIHIELANDDGPEGKLAETRTNSTRNDQPDNIEMQSVDGDSALSSNTTTLAQFTSSSPASRAWGTTSRPSKEQNSNASNAWSQDATGTKIATSTSKFGVLSPTPPAIMMSEPQARSLSYTVPPSKRSQTSTTPSAVSKSTATSTTKSGALSPTPSAIMMSEPQSRNSTSSTVSSSKRSQTSNTPTAVTKATATSTTKSGVFSLTPSAIMMSEPQSWSSTSSAVPSSKRSQTSTTPSAVSKATATATSTTKRGILSPTPSAITMSDPQSRSSTSSTVPSSKRSQTSGAMSKRPETTSIDFRHRNLMLPAVSKGQESWQTPTRLSRVGSTAPHPIVTTTIPRTTTTKSQFLVRSSTSSTAATWLSSQTSITESRIRSSTSSPVVNPRQTHISTTQSRAQITAGLTVRTSTRPRTSATEPGRSRISALQPSRSTAAKSVTLTAKHPQISNGEPAHSMATTSSHVRSIQPSETRSTSNSRSGSAKSTTKPESEDKSTTARPGGISRSRPLSTKEVVHEESTSEDRTPVQVVRSSTTPGISQTSTSLSSSLKPSGNRDVPSENPSQMSKATRATPYSSISNSSNTTESQKKPSITMKMIPNPTTTTTSKSRGIPFLKKDGDGKDLSSASPGKMISCSQPCLNGGECQVKIVVVTTRTKPLCKCPYGFSGDSCEIVPSTAGYLILFDWWVVLLIVVGVIFVVSVIGVFTSYLIYRKNMIGKYDVEEQVLKLRGKKFKAESLNTIGEMDRSKGASYASLAWHERPRDSWASSGTFSTAASV